VPALRPLESSSSSVDAPNPFRHGGSIQGRGQADRWKDQHEPGGEEKEPPRGKAANEEEPQPEFRIEHQDVSVVEQRMSGPEGKEHSKSPEVVAEKAGSPRLGAL
jgi:hypothetical protein